MAGELTVLATGPSALLTEAQAINLARRAFDAGLRELSRLDAISGLQDLHAQAATLEHYLTRFLQDRDGYHRCQVLMAELRLRIERKIGAWLAYHVNHQGGGDRRSPSRGVTAVGDLPDGVSKNQSSRWQRVAAVPEAAFEAYLVNARDSRKEISTAGLLRWAEKLRQGSRERGSSANPAVEVTAEDLWALVERGQQFGTVYADPPWPYSNRATRGAAENHYPTMSLAEVAALPVARLAADQAHCHLWTTNAFLFEAREVLQAWGFEYKGVFLWVKPSIGLGNYWHVAHEFLLLGVRGGCTFLDRTQRSWQAFEPGRHSAKPEEVRQIIMRTSPGPYLELFARRQVPGWTVWGDEVEAATVAPAENSGREVADGRAHL